jgi:cyanophycinase
MESVEVERLSNANVIFFTDGDRLRITNYDQKGFITKTNAGASTISETNIYEGESGKTLSKGKVQLTSGKGLVKNIVIDGNFIKRGSFSRLIELVTSHPGNIGLGLGEDAGVIIRQGYLIETIGDGLVVIFDGQYIKYSNISNVQMGEAIAVANVSVHTLVKGHGYNLLTRRYLIPSEMGGSTD